MASFEGDRAAQNQNEGIHYWRGFHFVLDPPNSLGDMPSRRLGAKASGGGQGGAARQPNAAFARGIIGPPDTKL